MRYQENGSSRGKIMKTYFKLILSFAVMVLVILGFFIMDYVSNTRNCIDKNYTGNITVIRSKDPVCWHNVSNLPETIPQMFINDSGALCFITGYDVKEIGIYQTVDVSFNKSECEQFVDSKFNATQAKVTCGELDYFYDKCKRKK